MLRAIAITMRKGGSGKTTTAVNLAAALVQRGRRVLLVDLDPQANATIAVGVNPLEGHTINNLFLDGSLSPQQAITQTSFGLDVIPAHMDLARTEGGMRASDVVMLRSIMQPLEDSYDYIILDTPPSESFLTVNALAYATGVIIPLQAHYFAMEGLAQALDQVAKVRAGLNPHISLIGILPTLVNHRTNIARTVIEAVEKAYPKAVLKLSIDYSVRHPETSARGVPIVVYDPQHPGALAYKRLAEYVDGKAKQ